MTESPDYDDNLVILEYTLVANRKNVIKGDVDKKKILWKKDKDICYEIVTPTYFIHNNLCDM
jgi:hypothetical protein